jgi:hypothetical protein
MNNFCSGTCCKELTTCTKMQHVVICSDLNDRIGRVLTQPNSTVHPLLAYLTIYNIQRYTVGLSCFTSSEIYGRNHHLVFQSTVLVGRNT